MFASPLFFHSTGGHGDIACNRAAMSDIKVSWQEISYQPRKKGPFFSNLESTSLAVAVVTYLGG